jgi:hypothetical protein
MVLAILSACSGGGTAMPSQPLLRLVSKAGASGQIADDVPARTPQERRRRENVTFHLRIPHRRHRARYISPATKGLTLAFTGASNLTDSIALTPAGNPDCHGTGSATTCQIDVLLLSGSYTVAISTFDQAPAGGRIPGSAHLLSTAKAVPFTVTKGVANALSATLDGVPASLMVSGLPSGVIGTPFSAQSFSVTAKDADGDVIVGTYDTPVTLADSDTRGHTSIATSGADSPAAGKLSSSSDLAKLSYGGQALLSAIITASASAATVGTATFAPFGIFSASTTTGLIGTSVSESLTGNFVAGNTTVVFSSTSGGGVTMRNVVATATTLTVDMFIDPETPIGSAYTIEASSGSLTSLPTSFTVSNTTVDVVSLDTDSSVGVFTSEGICPGGNSGELRYWLCHAQPGDTIVFDTTLMCGGALPCTITLNANLPPIVHSQTIDGGYFGRVTVDGGGQLGPPLFGVRAFWVDAGNVTLANLQIQNAIERAGSGGGGGGGGAAAFGAGLYVGTSANVTVLNDYFATMTVIGGAGGLSISGGGGGGGGVGYSNGGSGGARDGAGGGGAQRGDAGSDGRYFSGMDYGGAGSAGGGGGGAALSGGTDGIGGSAFGANSIGQAGANDLGGGAGLGGGGGGGDVNGGGGGFGLGGGGGGGGGAGPNGVNGGAGGEGGVGAGGGGGGAAGAGASPGQGGAGGPPFGGSGGNDGNGGGGGAAGAAIFVFEGQLTTVNSGSDGNMSVTAGQAQGSASGGTTDSTPVYSDFGTVNGTAGTGAVPTALSGSTPSLRRAHDRRHRVKA